LWCASFGAIIRKDVCMASLSLSLSLSLSVSPYLDIHSIPTSPHHPTPIKLTLKTATKRRKVHHRQRPSCRLELQIRNGTRSLWRNHVEHDGRGRAGVQVHRPWHDFPADQEPTAILSVVGGKRRGCVRNRWCVPCEGMACCDLAILSQA